jgi:hypothetical protein
MKYSPSSHMFILALDDNVEKVASSMKNVTVISLREIEAYCPNLLAVKSKRQKKEYYATITPIFPQFIINMKGMNELYYVDSDIAFWSAPEEMESVMGHESLLVTPHENPATKPGGFFNVGILGYRNDGNCRNFLKWWEKKCIKWCRWEARSDGRCADQGYLNVLQEDPARFPRVKISDHPGINIGPWNIAMHELGVENENLTLDSKINLICYHFHGFKKMGEGYINDTGWNVPDNAMRNIYDPYNELINKAERGEI